MELLTETFKGLDIKVTKRVGIFIDTKITTADIPEVVLTSGDLQALESLPAGPNATGSRAMYPGRIIVPMHSQPMYGIEIRETERANAAMATVTRVMNESICTCIAKDIEKAKALAVYRETLNSFASHGLFSFNYCAHTGMIAFKNEKSQYLGIDIGAWIVRRSIDLLQIVPEETITAVAGSSEEVSKQDTAVRQNKSIPIVEDPELFKESLLDLAARTAARAVVRGAKKPVKRNADSASKTVAACLRMDATRKAAK